MQLTNVLSEHKGMTEFRWVPLEEGGVLELVKPEKPAFDALELHLASSDGTMVAYWCLGNGKILAKTFIGSA